MATKYYIVSPISIEWPNHKTKDYQYYTVPEKHMPVICTGISEAKGWMKEFTKENPDIQYGIFELKFESFWNKALSIPIIKEWTDQHELIPQGPI